MILTPEQLSKELSYANRVLHEFMQEDDRASALLIGAEFDRIILAILSNHLLNASESSSPLLDRNGPLEAFASRIELAFRLGLIPPVFHHDLHRIRRIRNYFAHGPAGLNFNEPKIARIAAQLLTGRNATESMLKPEDSEEKKQSLLNPKNLFGMSCTMLIGHLVLLQFQVRPVGEPWRDFFSTNACL